MVTWLRKAEVPVPVRKAVTCLIRAQSNRKLQPGEAAEYAWVTPVRHVDSHQGTPSPRQPSRLLPANSSSGVKTQNDKPLPRGVFPRGLASPTQTISSTRDFIKMTKPREFNLLSCSSSMASRILWQTPVGAKQRSPAGRERRWKSMKLYQFSPAEDLDHCT